MACATGLLFAGFAFLLTAEQCQTVSEVRPGAPLEAQRLPYHLALIFLLVTATVTDLLDYVIPDPITVTGMLLGLAGATISGDLQMIHIWVDWSVLDVSIYGPWLPQWMKDHHHWHGLAWSLSGIGCGASIVWAGRIFARGILKFHSIGFGDVTLMAMVGAFLGWQPVLCILAVAPIVGLVIGFLIWLTTGRSYVAFGPYLCIATLIVMCTWRLLWETERLRLVFSHWPTIITLVTGAIVVYCFLLFGLRWFLNASTDQLRA